VAGGPYSFSGLNTLGYPDYRDLGTGRMLVAAPGESYEIAAIDGQLVVPPPDGRWAAASSGAPPGITPPPPVPPVPAVEGSEAA
jgi:hypothetical protein